jgi:hypothetical protein
MYQLITITAIITVMDVVLLGVEFANLYLIETILKNIIYSIKLKIEFVVLGKLVHFIRDGSSGLHSGSAVERRGTSHGLGLEKPHSGASPDQHGRQSSTSKAADTRISWILNDSVGMSRSRCMMRVWNKDLQV